VDDGAGGTQPGLGSPVTLSGTPATHATSCAPQVGEHSHTVLAQFGFSAGEISELQAAGVIRQHEG
jgi:crotonobetainyl-CoA:carnitine CoA-transferase CaiB-like acyl-CoA transferase